MDYVWFCWEETQPVWGRGWVGEGYRIIAIIGNVSRVAWFWTNAGHIGLYTILAAGDVMGWPDKWIFARREPMRVSGMMGKGCAAAAVAVVVGGVSRGAVNYGVDNPVSLGIGGYTQNFDSLPAGTGAGTAQTGGWYPTVGSDSNPRLAGWVGRLDAGDVDVGHERADESRPVVYGRADGW